MGFWNFISSITDSLKHGLKRIWGYVSSVTDSLKWSILDPVKNFCQTSYDHVCATVSTVKVKVIEKLNQYLPDQEARYRLAINLAKNALVFAVLEGSKYIPGGVKLYHIASKSLRDVKQFEDPKKEVKALKLMVRRLEEKVSVYGKALEQAEMHKQDVELKSQTTLHFDSNVYQKPEDQGDQNLHDEGIHRYPFLGRSNSSSG